MKKSRINSKIHQVPEDLRKAIISTPAAREVWQDITPLARNEFI
ncbi:MAG: YdeI/OmpD-associated family protein [bacterium]|nr:YdeI/OmpD-associated family protein [bacterium]